MRPVHIAQLEVPTPVLVLTRQPIRRHVPVVTVAPIASGAGLGLSSELAMGVANGLSGPSHAQLDETMTLPTGLLSERIGYLMPEQEIALARAIVLAFDLDVPLFSWE